jgi:hypothetical protein
VIFFNTDAVPQQNGAGGEASLVLGCGSLSGRTEEKPPKHRLSVLFARRICRRVATDIEYSDL